MARAWLGSSGWSYPSWRPGFYPAGLANENFLSFYAERLPSVELNTTGYRLPSEEQFARWAAQVPPGFRFPPKLPPRALRLLGTFEERATARRAPRAGASRRRDAADDGLLALLLGSTSLRLALDLRDDVGGRRRRPWPSESTTGRPTRLSLPPFPRASLHRGRLAGIAARVGELVAAGVDVFAYFRHEDSPTAVAYAGRVLQLLGTQKR